MGHVYVPEIVPEVAEKLVSLEGLRWSLATGAYRGELYLSLRLNDRRIDTGMAIAAFHLAMSTPPKGPRYPAPKTGTPPRGE